MAQSDKLLTPAQVTKCKKIAATNSKFSSRAAVLLSLHGGATQAEAASAADLTLYQVKYWLNKFRQLGMAAFPPVEEQTAATENTDAKKPAKDKSTDKAKKSKTKTKTKKDSSSKDKKQKKKDKDGKNKKSDKKAKKAKDKKKSGKKSKK